MTAFSEMNVLYPVAVLVVVVLTLQVGGQGELSSLLVRCWVSTSCFPTGLTLMLNNQPIASGCDVIITDIGEHSRALICMTDNATCCSNQRGHWLFPDGSPVSGNRSGGDIYRTRGPQIVFLHRRNNALGPLGSYCCDVDTVADPDARVCINIL